MEYLEAMRELSASLRGRSLPAMAHGGGRREDGRGFGAQSGADAPADADRRTGDPASASDVLAEFGMKGNTIPSWFKQTTKWFISGDVTRDDFVNALNDFKKRGLLNSGPSPKKIDTTIDSIEKLTNQQTANFGLNFDDHTTPVTVDNISAKLSKVKAIANNPQIQKVVSDSNLEFYLSADPVALMQEREKQWKENITKPVDFMNYVLTNKGTLIAQAIIDTDKDSDIPIKNILVTNSLGATVISTSLVSDYKQNDDNWWIKTKESGLHITSGSSEEYYGQNIGEISIPIYDSGNDFIGIISVQLNLEQIIKN